MSAKSLVYHTEPDFDLNSGSTISASKTNSVRNTVITMVFIRARFRVKGSINGCIVNSMVFFYLSGNDDGD